MELFDKLLDYYDLSLEEYKFLSRPVEEIKLIDPKSILGMDKVLSRIHKAIINKEKILIYGDYDCDGVCATSIMVKTFRYLNYPVSYYIPSRYIDGYGLNIINVDKIALQNFKLIVTVDNGITAYDAINRAKELGIDVLVIDHHEVGDEENNALAIIHPEVSNISSICGSGGYMSLFVSAALLDRYDDYLLTLAGLSTVSDLMELKGYNRDLLRLAIANFKKYNYLNLALLKDNPIINEQSFSIDIAPKINAVGRLKEDKSVNNLVKYLISEDKDEINKLAKWIILINEERKEFSKNAILNLPSFNNDDGICLLSDIKEGLIGLIANRLLNQYNVPSIVFTPDINDPSFLKGSIRSKDGFNVTKAFNALDKYICDGGGHALAGGLTIKREDFPSFKEEFLKLTKEYKIIDNPKKAIEISLIDINRKNYELIKTFSPFGKGNEEPLFVIKDIPTRGLNFSYDGKHLLNALSLNSKLVAFNVNEKEFKKVAKRDLFGHFYLSSFHGRETIEFRVSELR